MFKRGSSARSIAENAAQDGVGLPPRMAKDAYREAAQKFFYKQAPKDPLPLSSSPKDCSGEHSETDDTAPLDTSAIPLLEWDTVSMQADIFTVHSAQAPNSEETELESTLIEILCVVTACNTSITSLAADIKGVKAELSFICQDMQKLRDCTAALEG